jgi:hypothetical protein
MPQWLALASAGVRHCVTRRIDTKKCVKGAIVTLEKKLEPAASAAGLAFGVRGSELAK